MSYSQDLSCTMANLLLDALRQSGVPFELTQFPENVFTADGVAKVLGIRLAQVAKAMLIKVADGSVLVGVVPGDKRVDLKAIKRHLNGKGVRLVDRTEVSATVGLEVGAVTPLIGLANAKVKIYFDEALAREDTVNISSGDLQLGVSVRAADLIAALKATVLSIST